MDNRFKLYFVIFAIISIGISAALFIDASAAQAAKTAKSFTFTTAGDYEINDNTTAVLSEIRRQNPNFHLALGDFSYSAIKTERAWCDYAIDKIGYQVPINIVAGNHDLVPNSYIDSFTECLGNHFTAITGRYGKEYYYDYLGLARIIMISPGLEIADENFDYSNGTSHSKWLSNAIDSARKAKIPWVIVGMHKNCITVGIKECETGQDVIKTLIAKKVDLILQAHDHTYQRSKQLANSRKCTSLSIGQYNSQCVVDDGSDGLYKKGKGSVVVIAGMGGHPSLYTVSDADSDAGYFTTWMGKNSKPTYGFAKITVTAKSLISDFVGVGNQPAYSDHFVIR